MFTIHTNRRTKGSAEVIIAYELGKKCNILRIIRVRTQSADTEEIVMSSCIRR